MPLVNTLESFCIVANRLFTVAAPLGFFVLANGLLLVANIFCAPEIIFCAPEIIFCAPEIGFGCSYCPLGLLSIAEISVTKLGDCV